MRRPAQPEEMVGPVPYLCSDAASDVSGQVHVADGALTVRGLFSTDMLAHIAATQ
jgi:NAD(P)-dependent dehydrogenase (short-subunit alcohol dehydrogenase family)